MGDLKCISYIFLKMNFMYMQFKNFYNFEAQNTIQRCRWIPFKRKQKEDVWGNPFDRSGTCIIIDVFYTSCIVYTLSQDIYAAQFLKSFDICIPIHVPHEESKQCSPVFMSNMNSVSFNSFHWKASSMTCPIMKVAIYNSSIDEFLKIW